MKQKMLERISERKEVYSAEIGKNTNDRYLSVYCIDFYLENHSAKYPYLQKARKSYVKHLANY